MTFKHGCRTAFIRGRGRGLAVSVLISTQINTSVAEAAGLTREQQAYAAGCHRLSVPRHLATVARRDVPH